jgi:enterochelin esterase family protein
MWVPTYLALLCLLAPALAWSQQANVNLDYNPQKNTENLIPFSASLNSPDVRDDGTVTFRLKAPAAKEVRLTGAVLTGIETSGGKPLPFTKGDDGVWTLTVGPLKPDMYIYGFDVDGVRIADPNNTVAGFTAMPPYSQLIVHGDGPAYYDARNVPHGTVTRHVYHSDVTNGERELYVYTPPNYDKSKRYPVLYLVGGSGDLPSNWVYDGRVNFMMDNLLADGKVVPMVIAIPNNQVVHRNNPRHVELTFKLFESELRQHVIPLVEREYSVRKEPKGSALSGLSMGDVTRCSSVSILSICLPLLACSAPATLTARTRSKSFSTIRRSTRRLITCLWGRGPWKTRGRWVAGAWRCMRRFRNTISPTSITSEGMAATTGPPGVTYSISAFSPTCGAKSDTAGKELSV